MRNSDSKGPSGQLALQVIAMPKDTNANGDIFAGWLMQQMDMAAASKAAQISKGRATTVAVERIEFLSPVSVGDQVSCYAELLDTGRSSMKIRIEVYAMNARGGQPIKITEAIFIYVAINDMGGIRSLPNHD